MFYLQAKLSPLEIALGGISLKQLIARRDGIRMPWVENKGGSRVGLWGP